MKFYYDGELIRTSKTHNYTHAVVAPAEPGAKNRWVTYGCRTGLPGAQALLNDTMKRVGAYNKKTAELLRIVELEAREK